MTNLGNDHKENMYCIELNQTQLEQLSFACELAARVLKGQVSAIVDALPLNDDCDAIELQSTLESLIRPNVGSDKTADDYFLMYQCLRYRLAWDKNPKGGFGVNYDKPVSLNNSPLIQVFKKDIDSQDDSLARRYGLK